MLAHPRTRQHPLGAVRAISFLSHHARRGNVRSWLSSPDGDSVLGSADLSLNLPPEFERAADVPEGFLRSTGPGDDDRAVAEQAAEQTLIDVDSFHFAEHCLDGAPAQPAHLDHDALV